MAAINIADFSVKYIKLARQRGMTARNPIEFEFRPNANDQTDIYRLVVSLTEPSFADKPYNLLWIDANPGSPQYKQVLIRTSHVSDGSHRASWMVVTDYASLFSSKQYYSFVAENASDLGIDAGDSKLPIANTTRLGTVILRALQQAAKESARDVNDPVVVSTDDPRMTDDRYPNFHTHPDYPRTKIRLNDTAYVEVASSVPPKVGSVLSIVRRDPTDATRYIGQWQAPTSKNVAWSSPHLLNLKISLPGGASFMQDNSSVGLIATAEWQDKVVVSPEGVVWSIENNALGVTISSTGVVTAPDLPRDVTLLVTAKLKDPVYGNTVTATYSLLIKNSYVAEDSLVSLKIVGADTMLAGQKQTFSVLAVFKVAGSSAVKPDNFTDDNVKVLSLTGLVGTAGTVTADTPVLVTATYTYLGVLYTATKTVTVKAQKVEKLEILGPTTIQSESTGSYTFRITWTNGVQEFITPNTFLADPDTYTTIAGNIVTALKQDTTDRNIVLRATYVSNGNTVSGQLPVTIIHKTPVPVITSLAIVGANTIQEGKSENYTFVVTYSDKTTKTINPLTFSVDKAQFATIVNKTVTAGQVDADQTVVLSASYKENGTTLNATLNVKILNVIPIVNLASIRIVGATSVQQNTQNSYTVLATYSDGHTATVKPNEFKLSDVSQYATFDGSSGILTVGPVNVASASVTIAATYIENGITMSATLPVGIVGQPPVVVDLVIEAKSPMNENTSQTVVCYAVYSDNSRVKVSSPKWSITQGTTYASIAQTGVLSAGEVDQDQSVIIRAEYNSLSTQATVVIKNIVVVKLASIDLKAPSPVYAFGSAVGTARDLHTILTFSDSTTREGVASELSYTLASGDTQTYFSLVQPTSSTGWGITTKAALSGYYGDKTFTINVTATVGTVVLSDTVSFTVTGPTDSVATVALVGPDSVTEGTTSENYTVAITRASGKVETYTTTNPSYVLSSGGAYAQVTTGTVAYGCRVTVPADSITSDQTAVLTIKAITIDGKSYTPTKSIKLLNVDSAPTASLVGPNVVKAGATGTYILRLTFPSTGKTTDLTTIVTYGGAGTDTDKIFTYNGNATITGNVISTTKSATIKGSGTYNGVAYTATMSVTNPVEVVVPSTLTISGPDVIIGGQTGQYTGSVVMSDGTVKDVTTSSTWAQKITSGTIASSSISAAGLLSTGVATVEGVIRITLTYTENGTTKTATKDVKISVQQTDKDPIGARFGVSSKITNLDNYTQAWALSLSTVLGQSGEQFLECTAGQSTTGNNKFFYAIWPKALGYGYFRDYTSGSYGFSGSWDGASELDDFNFTGGLDIKIGGRDYIIYRNDFPFDNTYYKYSLMYGSSDPLSGKQ